MLFVSLEYHLISSYEKTQDILTSLVQTVVLFLDPGWLGCPLIEASVDLVYMLKCPGQDAELPRRPLWEHQCLAPSLSV